MYIKDNCEQNLNIFSQLKLIVTHWTDTRYTADLVIVHLSVGQCDTHLARYTHR